MELERRAEYDPRLAAERDLAWENEQLRTRVAVLRREIRRVNACYRKIAAVYESPGKVRRLVDEHAYMTKEITRLQARVAELETQHHARQEAKHHAVAEVNWDRGML